MPGCRGDAEGVQGIKASRMTALLGCGPLPVTVANEGLQGFSIKNVIFLVATVTGLGPHPKFIYIYIYIDGASINHLLAVVSFRCLQVSAYIPTNEALYHSDIYS